MFYPKSMNAVLATQELTITELRALKAKRVGDYFQEALDSDLVPGDLTDSLTFDEMSMQRFNLDFDRLFKSVKGLQGLSQAKNFHEWWQENRQAYLTRPVVTNYRQNQLTLGDFFDDLHLHFIGNLRHRRGSSALAKQCKRISKNKAFISTLLFISFIVQKSWAAAISLVLLGPGVQMVNSYTQPVITPLAQTASQTGAKDLGRFASSIQGWLTNRDRLKKVSADLHAVTDDLKKADFNHMTPAQAQAHWQKFEESYFSLFLRYNQTLPSHLRDGRGVLRDLMIFTPINLASNLSAFDTQYWLHRDELETLQNKGSRGRKLSRKERELKIRHQQSMEDAESRIAGALAAWKLYEFMYPELVAAPENRKSKGDLNNTYQTFAKSMRFERYVGQFASKMDEVLRQIDTEFLIQDRLAQGADMPPVPAAAGASKTLTL
ncbi:MAG: hypothetical protein H7222_02180 [Methylotenera sp.]|nr:hypothetical protein [Oligoflexia bacterium]